MKKYLKRIPISALLAILCVVLACVVAWLITVNIHAESTGGMLGQRIGTYSGRALGSLEGMTTGQIEGSRAGSEAGLSGEDTIAELSGKIQEVEKLQVLAASGMFSDILTVGEDYAALLAMRYNAVFTVDLLSAEIMLEENKLYIFLEQPEVELTSVGEIEKENEYQKYDWTGSAERGYTALNNTVGQMERKAKEKFKEDEYMMKVARASAEKQLVQLVNAVSVSNPKPQVIVEFRSGENDE